MLRTNLSTRPFYNERAVHLLLGLVALVVLVFTALNLFEIIRLSQQNTELAARINRDRSEAERLTREAIRIRKGINKEELQLVVAAAREANSLIDQRTFSWTSFFNRIEETLPPDVMLTSVQPILDAEATKVSMTVLGRRTADIDEFMEKLEATGAFENVLPRQQEELEGGMNRVTVDAIYIPVVEDTKPSEKTAPAPPKPAGGVRQSAEVRR